MLTMLRAAIRMLTGVSLAGAFAPMATGSDNADIRSLIEQVASGRDQDRQAADQLVDALVAPIADAFGAMEARSAEEQLRLRPVLARLHAQIRIRMLRANLAPPQRKLLDAFAEQRRVLLEQLFDDSEYVRIDALHRIPLEPGTAAGILIVARVDDWNEAVADQALELAREFHDEQVLAGLTKYVADVVATLKSGIYGPDDQDVARTVGTWAQVAVGIIGQARHREALPTITDAVEFFEGWRYRDPAQLADCLDALGTLGDESSAPLLVRFLDQRERRFTHPAPGEKTVVQTVGDAALLNLLRIFKLPPEPLGFISGADRDGPLGFSDERARAAARQAFVRWFDENKHKPAEKRTPLAVPATPAASAPAQERP